jgi:BirA family biotin operon repressor/biotin-[acetyl-CoA-carboxylase] ligase
VVAHPSCLSLPVADFLLLCTMSPFPWVVQEGFLAMADFEPLFLDAPAAAALGRKLEYHRLVASTNDLATAAARAGAAHGHLVLAEEQSAGRGRRGRAWRAPPGRALLLSLVVRGPALRAGRLGWLALAVGLAAVEAIRRGGGVAARVKWPNDVVVVENGERPHFTNPGCGKMASVPLLPWRKLGGVLVESAVAGRNGPLDYAIAGVGLNVLQTADELPELSKAPATSVRLEAAGRVSRPELLAELLPRLDARVAWVTEAGSSSRGFEALRADVRARLDEWWGGWRFEARAPEGTCAGLFAGLDDHGRLRLKTASGRETVLADAELLGGTPAAR